MSPGTHSSLPLRHLHRGMSQPNYRPPGQHSRQNERKPLSKPRKLILQKPRFTSAAGLSVYEQSEQPRATSPCNHRTMPTPWETTNNSGYHKNTILVRATGRSGIDMDLHARAASAEPIEPQQGEAVASSRRPIRTRTTALARRPRTVRAADLEVPFGAGDAIILVGDDSVMARRDRLCVARGRGGFQIAAVIDGSSESTQTYKLRVLEINEPAGSSGPQHDRRAGRRCRSGGRTPRRQVASRSVSTATTHPDDFRRQGDGVPSWRTPGSGRRGTACRSTSQRRRRRPCRWPATRVPPCWATQA